jgi:hypothetical protein
MEAAFQATLRSASGSGSMTYVAVPAAVMKRFAPRKRVPVKATLGGVTYRTTIADMGFGPCLGVRKEIREQAHIEAGQCIRVTLELDLEERSVTIPPDLRKAMNGRERELFERFSYTQRKEFVQAIEGAKQQLTRERRIAKTLEAIRAKL